MTNKEYKRRLEEHDEGKYYLEHYTDKTYSHWDCGIRYNATTENLRDFRENMKAVDGYKISDRAYFRKEGFDTILTSYYTDVAKIDKDGNFIKLWEGYSVTTMKHINTFLEWFGFDKLSKKEWVMMDTKNE